MSDQPPKGLNIHFRFKLLAITCISFMLFVILTAPKDISEFYGSVQFNLIGPWLIIFGIWYLLLRKKSAPCPYCGQAIALKKRWECPECRLIQPVERFIFDKCRHCRTIQTTSTCEHCGREFRL